MRSPSHDLPLHSSPATARHRRHRPTFFALLLAFSGLSFWAPAVHAQAATLHISRLNTDALPELKVYVAYVAPDGSAISGPVDFKLSVDAADKGPATAQTTFEAVNEPEFVVTITQVSGAVREPVLTEVKAGFRRLGQAVAKNPASRLSVLSYAATTKKLLPSGGAAEVEGALAKLQADAATGDAHLLAAIQTALDLLKAQPAGRRKVIVVVSDGTDVNPDKRAFSDLGTRAQQAGVVIDTIGYSELDPSKLRNLQELTRRSYGTFRGAKSATEVGTQLGAVADELQKQYVVAFRLPSDGDGQEHTLQVSETSSGKTVYSNLLNVKLPAHPKPAPVPVPVPVHKPLPPPPT